MKLLFLAIVFASAVPALAEEGPCKQISQTCVGAGFKKNDWKAGDGLMRDCVNPIIQGIATVPGATKPLPTVDAKLIAACKAKRPKFGMGKIGSEAKK